MVYILACQTWCTAALSLVLLYTDPQPSKTLVLDNSLVYTTANLLLSKHLSDKLVGLDEDVSELSPYQRNL